MENKKDIGALVEQKLREATKTPNDALWGKINATLDANEKKRRRFLYFLFGGGGLVALLLLITVVAPSLDHSIGNPHENSVDESTVETRQNSTKGIEKVESEAGIIDKAEGIEDTEVSENPSEAITNNPIIKNTTSETKANTTFKLSENRKPFTSEKKVIRSLQPEKSKVKDSVTTYVYFNSKDGTQIETTRKSIIDSLVTEPQTRESIVPDSLKTIENDSILKNKNNPL